MTEYGRLGQIKDLEEKGWKYDSDCDFYEREFTCGGPSFLKNPNGIIHWISCGKSGPINGRYFKSLNEKEYVELNFEHGILVEYGLPKNKSLDFN